MSERCIQYAVLINDLIAEAVQEGKLNFDVFVEDSEAFKDFIHAFATVAPNQLFNKLTGQEKNNIEFNHLANILCFENSTMEK